MGPKFLAPVALLSIAAMLAAGPAYSQKRTLCVHDVGDGMKLNVRTRPSLTAGVVARLDASTCGLALAGPCEKGWCRMSAGGMTGWIMTRYVGVYEYPSPPVGESTPATDTAKPLDPAGPSPTIAATAKSAPAAASAESLPPHPAGRTSGDARAPSTVARKAPAATTAETVASRSPHRTRAPSACVVRVASWDTLRIRSGPGTGHETIGAIPPGACRVEPRGSCRGPWCRVAWHGRVGWVNSYYLD